MTSMKSISRFIFPDCKNIEGVCAFCGHVKTKIFFDLEKVVSDNFVYFTKVKGNQVCYSCYQLFKDGRFRNSCFIAVQDKVNFVKRSDILPFLVSPIYPFVVYVTKSYKKQGWLDGMRYISLSNDLFFIHTDFVGVVKTTYDEFVNLVEIVKKLLSNKISKKHILGDENIYLYKVLIEKNLEEEFEFVKKYRNNPLLEVVVYVI